MRNLVFCSGGSAKGFLPAWLGLMGELTDVASAKRGVLGVDNGWPDEELDEVLDLTLANLGLVLLSSSRGSGSNGDIGLV